MNNLIQALKSFAKYRVAVLGDLMLDRYVWGQAHRISPEAPVPVVTVNKESAVPGGASNVARNILSLKGKAVCLGIVGDDENGRNLTSLLETAGADTSGIVIDRKRRTTVKTRVLASTQQVVRIDEEDCSPLSSAIQERLLKKLQGLLTKKKIDALILEDYAKGLFSKEFMSKATELARNAGIPVTLDPHPMNLFEVHGLKLMTPNRMEAFRLAGVPLTESNGLLPSEDNQLCKVGKLVLKKWACDELLITLGADGMALFTKNSPVPFHIPTKARQVFDVSGAGDTVMATITLALLAGLSSSQAAVVANYAASIVVGLVGTAAVPFDELAKLLKNNEE